MVEKECGEGHVAIYSMSRLLLYQKVAPTMGCSFTYSVVAPEGSCVQTAPYSYDRLGGTTQVVQIPPGCVLANVVVNGNQVALFREAQRIEEQNECDVKTLIERGD